MARIVPFKAYRPPKELADKVISRTFDTYHKEERKKVMAQNPYSFLHIIDPDKPDEKRTKPNSQKRFEKVIRAFDSFKDHGYLIEEQNKALYIYEQTAGDHSYLGFIGCASIDDHIDNTIKKHEQTLSRREELLKDYLKVVDINADPVLLSYPDDPELSHILEKYRQTPPEYDIRTSDDGKGHRLWVMNDPDDISLVKSLFAHIPSIYIADGHHRSASSVRLGLEERKKKGAYTGHEGFNYFMAYFIPESRLNIHGYHRMIKDLNGLEADELMQGISKAFRVEKKDSPFEPIALHEMGMYLNGEWYELFPDPDTFDHTDPVTSLDASILQNNVLEPILNVDDPRTSERVDFHGAPKGLNPLKKAVDSGKYKVAFTLAPVPIDQLKQVADNNEVMPPKTTWVEPKLRSGLTIYRMDLPDSGTE